MYRMASAVALFLAVVHHADPQSPRLLKDIVPGTGGSYPSQFTELPSTTVFRAFTGNGFALWRTDGSGPGTTILAVFPSDNRAIPNSIVRLGQKAWFFRDGLGPEFTQLWECDGTAAGTRPVGVIQDLVVTASPIAAGDYIYFQGRHATKGWDLWRTDGTVQGTILLRDFNEPSTGAGLYVAAGSDLIFSIRDLPIGLELWKSDGTAAGTRLVKEIRPGVQDGVKPQFLRLGDSVFFAGRDADEWALWRTDGTAAGTTVHKSFGGGANVVNNLVNVSGDYVYWYTTASPAGLYAVHRRTAVATRVSASRSYASQAFKGGLLFTLLSGEPWFTDGTASGTVRLSVNTTSISSRTGIVPTGSRFAYFEDRLSGPWLTDGTAAGTRELLPMMTRSRELALCHGRLYFSGWGSSGPEPWVVDLGASSAARGTGLGIRTRIPDLAVSDPVIGRSVTVSVDNTLAGAWVTIGLDLDLNQPFRVASHAWIHVGPPSLVFLHGRAAGRRYTSTLGVPNDARLSGLPIVWQALLIGTGAARGFELTNAVITYAGG